MESLKVSIKLFLWNQNIINYILYPSAIKYSLKFISAYYKYLLIKRFIAVTIIKWKSQPIRNRNRTWL